VSSLFTRAEKDIKYGVTNYRQAHGLFVRSVPLANVVIMAEGDWFISHCSGKASWGYAGFVQVDWELVQGVHVMGTGEMMNGGAAGEPHP